MIVLLSLPNLRYLKIEKNRVNEFPSDDYFNNSDNMIREGVYLYSILEDIELLMA